MKKAVSFVLALLTVIMSLTGCTTTEKEKYPLTVNSTPIDSEIFRYYLDKVWNEEDAGGTKEGRITNATHMCIRYVAVNSTFAAYGFSLSDSEKAEISEEANALWNMFGAYYEKIGVSKQTFIKIKTSEAYTEKLRVAFFDTGGTDEFSDAELRGVLVESFIAFRYVRTPVYNTDRYGNKTYFEGEEIAALQELYSEYIPSVTSSYGVENAFAEISPDYPLTEMSYETVVTDRDDHEFPSVFFDKIKNTQENTATVFRYEDYYYLVYRIAIVNDASIFNQKRSECLKIISEVPLQSKITAMCNAYTSERNKMTANEDYEQVGRYR